MLDRVSPATLSANRLGGAEVLIVVPALNEAATIEPCLRSLLTGDARLAEVDLIVADGGSRDGTAGIVRGLMADFPRLRLIPNSDRLQSAGINHAVATCAEPRHRVLVRADAHALYPPGYAMRAADLLVRRGAASVVVPMDSRGHGCFQKAAAWIVDTPLGSGGAAHRGGRKSREVDHGHHAAMDLGWFRKLGGYDAAFSHNEDAELDHRITQAGGRIWLAADLRLDYWMRPTLRALARQYWNYGRGRARTVRKHGLRPRLRQIAPVLNLILLGASLVAAAMGALADWPVLAALGLLWPLLYLTLLLAASAGMAMRHRSLCGLLAGPALAAMHLSWGAGFLAGTLRGKR
ncbi:glycosyltransferase family 2 protein [Paracoccus stylophorae]|uniref:Glycosyltransferase family 2 protein n=1 Tax=Paracoccus stylophorae TaxID=659350 RepID=A0ABY7SWF8_9RHOB|nr:glycosyltransferase family 2 protein [Paracoccus stylophorae]WCR10722.1 glycosyltransferase family 2 protein [Paracoccus stylophorae]